MRKKEIVTFVTLRMDLEDVTLSEIIETEKDKYHNFTYMWNLKKNNNKTNE